MQNGDDAMPSISLVGIAQLVKMLIFMPPTLKKLMGHIAFGACVRGWVTLFVLL